MFGSRRSAWNDGTALAWDCFGFHIYNTRMLHRVEVLIQKTPGHGRADPRLTAGKVTGLFGARDPWLTVETEPKMYKVCGFGLELVASVRAMKHWVSRWRRGLRGLRRQNASMVLAQKLPEMPALVQHVHSFL